MSPRSNYKDCLQCILNRLESLNKEKSLTCRGRENNSAALRTWKEQKQFDKEEADFICLLYDFDLTLRKARNNCQTDMTQRLLQLPQRFQQLNILATKCPRQKPLLTSVCTYWCLQPLKLQALKPLFQCIPKDSLLPLKEGYATSKIPENAMPGDDAISVDKSNIPSQNVVESKKESVGQSSGPQASGPEKMYHSDAEFGKNVSN